MINNILLNNGISIPSIGFGTYGATHPLLLASSLRSALELGYRHIDTASFYNNETIIGETLSENIVSRKDLFITSKLWLNEHGYEKALHAFSESTHKLKTDYLDLYLIHWPQTLNLETWKALEKLYTEGYVRAIGVSNFNISHLKELIASCNIPPAVNQIEFHPHLVQSDLLHFCQTYGIQTEAWSPLMRGQIFKEPLLQALADKYHKSIAQIVLRWDLQMGLSAIPKSIKINRLKENMDLFDFEITMQDMASISHLNDGTRIGCDPDLVYKHPEIITD